MGDDAAHLGHAHDAGAEHVAIERDRLGRTRDREEGREGRQPVRRPVRRVRPGHAGARFGGLSVVAHPGTVGRWATATLGHSRQVPWPVYRGGVEPDSRGVLRPERLPHFRRIASSGRGVDLARWYWIPQWDLPEGAISHQDVVAYPASNLVVEPDSVTLWGPTTRASRRDLTGRGWAIGALLLPAAVAAFTDDPGAAVDGGLPVDAADLLAAGRAAMDDGGDPDVPDTAQALDERAEHAARVMQDWLVRRVGDPGEEALRANEVADVLMNDASIRRLSQAADRLALSPRSLQRLTRRYVGIAPVAMIRRRRVQEAAERVRTEDVDLATIAVDLGYADQAHLTRDFTAVLGVTPRALRRQPLVAD